MKKYSGQEKCRAVLGVWSERRRASDICREMGISTSLLCQWQETAMEGMLRVLEPKWQEETHCPVLMPKLKKLLERKAGEQMGRLPKLERRLSRLMATEKSAG